jgi:hypothetical protein
VSLVFLIAGIALASVKEDDENSKFSHLSAVAIFLN